MKSNFTFDPVLPLYLDYGETKIRSINITQPTKMFLFLKQHNNTNNNNKNNNINNNITIIIIIIIIIIIVIIARFSLRRTYELVKL